MDNIKLITPVNLIPNVHAEVLLTWRSVVWRHRDVMRPGHRSYDTRHIAV